MRYNKSLNPQPVIYVSIEISSKSFHSDILSGKINIHHKIKLDKEGGFFEKMDIFCVK